MNKNHESVIEHESISVRIICDRGVTHEIVRHRIGSYSQESTRYVNYSKKGICFIIPPWVQVDEGYYNSESMIRDFFIEKSGNTYTNELEVAVHGVSICFMQNLHTINISLVDGNLSKLVQYYLIH